MPSNTVDLSAFQGFLARAAVDERFSADRFLAEIDAQGIELDLVNRLALQVRRHRHGPRAAARHRRPLRRLRPQRADLRPRPLRHLQPGQGAAQLELRRDPRARADRRRRLPLGLPAGPEDRHAAALGRQQHQGLRAQPLRRLRHRRHPADPRPRLAEADGGLARHRRAAGASPTSSPASSTPPSPPRAPRSTPATAPPATAPRGATSAASTSARSRPSPRSPPTAAASTTTPAISR